MKTEVFAGATGNVKNVNRDGKTLTGMSATKISFLKFYYL